MIGLEHADLRALTAVSVQVRQLIVRGEASIVEAIEEGRRRVVLRQRAGRCRQSIRFVEPQPHVDRGALGEGRAPF